MITFHADELLKRPADLEKTIAAEAAKAGMTVSDYVAGRLAQV